MRYLVSDIPHGYGRGVSRALSEGPDSLGFTADDISIHGKVVGNLTLWREGDIVTICGDISAIVALQCSRCLTTVMESVQPSVTLRCLPEASANAELCDTGEIRPEDDIYTYTDGFLDLRPIIREQLVLAIPPYSYCREDCQGLCPMCGENLNGSPCGCSAAQPDVRFAALQHFTKKLG